MAINLNPAHKGKLHKALDVPMGQKIPMGKIEKAAAGASPTVRKEAQFAENARGWNHRGQAKVTPVSSDRGAFKIKG